MDPEEDVVPFPLLVNPAPLLVMEGKGGALTNFLGLLSTTLQIRPLEDKLFDGEYPEHNIKYDSQKKSTQPIYCIDLTFL